MPRGSTKFEPAWWGGSYPQETSISFEGETCTELCIAQALSHHLQWLFSDYDGCCSQVLLSTQIPMIAILSWLTQVHQMQRKSWGECLAMHYGVTFTTVLVMFLGCTLEKPNGLSLRSWGWHSRLLFCWWRVGLGECHIWAELTPP